MAGRYLSYSYFLFPISYLFHIAYCFLLHTPSLPFGPGGKENKSNGLQVFIVLGIINFLSFFLFGHRLSFVICRLSFVACRLSLSVYSIFFESYLYLKGLTGSIELSRNL